MAVLRNKTGDLYVSHQAINERIAPNEVGSFSISEKAAALVRAPFTEASSIEIYSCIPKELDALCRKRKLMPTKSFSASDKSDEKIKEKTKISMVPHINNGNETHFFFAGGLVLYFKLSEVFALLVQPGDWLYIDGSTESWIKPTSESFFIIASYHSAPIAPVDEFHKRRVFTKTQPDFSIL